MLGNQALSKGNAMENTEAPVIAETALKRITTLSAGDPEMKFTQLMHHFKKENLLACYQELDGKKAKGNDGIDKIKYGEDLEKNLEDLVESMKRMAYIPGSVRQVLIPKEGKPGATRPLGISNFEDKMVQKMTQKILESIYEPLFYDCSYGFRPEKSCHDAIKDLQNYLHTHETETVIDVDLSNFFGSIDHTLLTEIVSKKIGDIRFIRYLSRMFKAGVLADGELTVSDEGVPQGSVCSPVLANIYAHEVIDVWMETMVKPACRGMAAMFRYADDVVICCQYSEDAERIKTSMVKRLDKFKLKMNEEKTKLVKFSKRKHNQGEPQETFDFLGFTFYLGPSRNGKAIPLLKTKGKSMRSKLKKVNEWMRANRCKHTTNEFIKRAAVKLRGHIQYYGVSHNSRSVGYFVTHVESMLFKWLNRRSQRTSVNWDVYRQHLRRINFPKAKLCFALF